MNELTNPYLLEAKHKKWQLTRWEPKTYLTIITGSGYTRATRRTFKRASDALNYGERVLARWRKKYDLEIMGMQLLANSPAE